MMLPFLALALSGCVYRAHRVNREAAQPPPVMREEVERMMAAGISEGVLIDLVDRRGAAHLSSEDLVALKKAGASETLLAKMIASERKEPPPTAVVVVEEEPVHVHYHCDHYYPYPFFGFSYSRWGRRSGWGLHYGW